MRKLLQLLVVACFLTLSAGMAFANSEKVTVAEGADLTNVHRLAIAMPLYTPAAKDEPTKEQVAQAIYDAHTVARAYILSYSDIVADIKKEDNIDLSALDRKQAAKAFQEHVAQFADAYVVTTVANNSRTVFFYDVYRAGTNQLLYSYQIVANNSQPNTVETFEQLSEQFYKNFERSVQKQLKADKKA